MRNTQNFNLLDEPGKTDKAVLLVRAISGSVDALFHSAECSFAEPMALATIAVGADGITFEIHKEPENTASNGAQILNFKKNFS